MNHNHHRKCTESTIPFLDNKLNESWVHESETSKKINHVVTFVESSCQRSGRKTPFQALQNTVYTDVLVEEKLRSHSLGCCGLVDRSHIIMTEHGETKAHTEWNYKDMTNIEIVVWWLVNPKLSEMLVEKASCNCLRNLINMNYKREVKY